MLRSIRFLFLAITFYVGPFMLNGFAEKTDDIEKTIEKLEQRVEQLETQSQIPQSATQQSRQQQRTIFDRNYNPSIGIILNGTYSYFSNDNSDIPGFALGEEGERGNESLSLDESELNFSGSVDTKFIGSLTTALAQEGAEIAVELEEAFIQTLPGSGLPTGLSIKFGRAFWTFGYLNEHHSHSDDFADRPLPYRIFLNHAFNDDGVEVSYILPTLTYVELGGGVFRGADFPFGEASGVLPGAYSGFVRVGGDIGDNQSWRLGGYALLGESDGPRSSNEDLITFDGKTYLFGNDFRYTLAPTANAAAQEITVQGEVFWRQENGLYEDLDVGSGPAPVVDDSLGWYAQTVYKFHRQWRVGARFSQLFGADMPSGLNGSLLDAGGFDPFAAAGMIDWTNSEFSRIRLQYNFESLATEERDHQIVLQYIVSLGAHSAHRY